MNKDFEEIEPAFREYVVAVLIANGATAESLKGFEDWELFAKIALKAEKPIPYVKWALRKQFEAHQETLKKALDAIKEVE